ncbi:uncharacterized protein LOC141524089 [Cotesia typhae]|uniref:uncharacterized protein LOC141524089 n=1 Tax=Cotesia typhae TaxID=2053667 RepID=UPI003D687A7E
MQIFVPIFVCFCLFFVSISSKSNFHKKNSFVSNKIEKKATIRLQRSIFKRLKIFPGTKWCGPGDIASHTYDLGQFNDTDKCCRNHDLCQPIILSKQTRYGIENKGRIAMLSCSCDSAFYKCLKAVNSTVSRIIGNSYFNLLHRKCFYFDAKKETFEWMKVPDFSDSSIIKFVSKFTRNPFKKESAIIVTYLQFNFIRECIIIYLTELISKTMRKLPFIFLIIYLASVQSETYFPTSDLELDDVPQKNGTKTWGTIFPGTKWCGQGNKAMHEDDFGKYRRTDMCCRNHDRCPKKIKAGMYKYGLQNSGSTTLLSCKCDEMFYDCLKEVQSITSQTVGILYFDILKRQCFAYDTEQDNGLYKWRTNRKFSDNGFIKFVSGII